MHVKVTKEFKGVPEGEVYPTLMKVGAVLTGNLAAAALANGWGEETDEQVAPAPTRQPSAKSDTKSDAAAPPPARPVARARMLKAHKYPDPETGREETLAKGLVVEGDLATEMAKLGLAQLLAPDGKAENKAVAAAPETK